MIVYKFRMPLGLKFHPEKAGTGDMADLCPELSTSSAEALLGGRQLELRYGLLCMRINY